MNHGLFNTRPGQWAWLAGLSAPLAWGLTQAGVPAALLLGPMLAGVVLGLAKARIRVASLAFALAQAVIGALAATAINAGILARLVQNWGLMLGGVAGVIGAGVVTGWVLLKLRVVPGTAAIWGVSPGGAVAMTVMSQAHGADARYVAFMQYFRLFLVVASASLVAKLFGVGPGLSLDMDMGFNAPLIPLISTLGLIVAGAVLGPALGLPAGALLLPMVAGAALQATGALNLTLPGWLLSLAYAGLGWYVGLNFTREVVIHVLRAIPALGAATGLLIALCAALAWGLSAFFGVAPLSAYLATSPGGLDTIAVISSAGGTDMGLVMAMQTLRLFAVVACWPWVVRWLRGPGGV